MERKSLNNNKRMKDRSSNAGSSLDHTIRSSDPKHSHNHTMMIKNIKPKVTDIHHYSSSSPSWKLNNYNQEEEEEEEDGEDKDKDNDDDDDEEEEENYNMMNGFSWPPRSYTCSFCKREFRSAQALGGHMNVHRKDRARLRQSPPISTGQYSIMTATLPPTANTTTTAMFISHNPNTNPNPSPNPTFSSSSTISSMVSSRLPPLIPYNTASINSSLCYSPYKSFGAANDPKSNKWKQPLLAHYDHAGQYPHHLILAATKGSSSDLAKMMDNKESVHGDYVRSSSSSSGIINECFVEKNMIMFYNNNNNNNNLKKQQQVQVETTANSTSSSTTVRLDLEIGVLGDHHQPPIKIGSNNNLDLELRLGYY
ncbi:uncharacterized protein LOC115723168 [Cannabis sativa]|uniref:uncharacterized protein LOC115723168 n=1 Tax=Cannabis sativa TaxID=3483 RepID=UPI0029C9BAC1|nr:uncharacterized protein LOC115723168 [Cannabis sativa]